MIRIVKMHFQVDRIPDFIEVFNEAKPKIEAFEGCHKVSLVQALENEGTLMTISEWDGPEALDAYRSSELFQSTWAKTKIHFSDKPNAWSVKVIA